MKLKSLLIPFFFSLFLISNAAIASTTGPGEEVPKEVRAKQIESRLLEIKHMDKSNLTSEQKKELRNEVKDLRKEARRKGIYLSLGAIVLILILLIIILK